MFLYTELYQKVSFPRKAIDIEFDLCGGVELGKVMIFYVNVNINKLIEKLMYVRLYKCLSKHNCIYELIMPY